MSTPNHQITKRELIEMLAPFDDHDKVEIRAHIDPQETVNPFPVCLFVDRAARENTERPSLILKAYEA